MRLRIRQAGERRSRSASLASQLWWTIADHWTLALCLLVYLVMTVLYALTIPIFETPDAGGHYAYIHELTEGRGLPIQGTPSGKRVTGYVASHPPLYYALSAALTWWVPDDVDFNHWAWRNPYQTMGDADRTVNKNILIHTSAEEFPWRGTALTMHIARFVSTLLGALAVIATYGIAVDLFPDRRWIVLGATGLAAFTPMFVFTSARVSNDAAVTAFASLALWGAVRLAVNGISRRGLVLIGIALGLAVLSKLSGIVFAPAVALALFFDSTRQWTRLPGEPWSRRLRPIIYRWMLVGVPFLAICGWWFVRNVVLYGELMGVDAWLSRTATVRAEPIGLLSVIPQLGGLEKSYWAMFGWFNVSVAPWMYGLWWVLVRAGILGLGLLCLDQVSSRRLKPRVQPVVPVVPVVSGAEPSGAEPSGAEPSEACGACGERSRTKRSRTKRSRTTELWGLIVIAAALLLNFGSVWRFIMIVEGAQGRYLMPAVAPISILLMLGLDRLVPERVRLNPWRYGLATGIGVTQVALTLICLLAFILPAYARPREIEERDLPDTMTRLDLSFEGTPIVLLGGHIEEDSVHPGDQVDVSLYWWTAEPPHDDHFVFLQILGRRMEPIAGVDCYPGGGTFPPTLWEPGVIYRDRYQLGIAADVDVPTAGLLHAGLYAEDGEHLSISSLAGHRPRELVVLDRVPVRPRRPVSDHVTYEVGARFGESITLVGYDVSAESVKPGDALVVTLVWRADAALEIDYTAFVHLLDSDDSLVVQSDHPPAGGAYPTSLWEPGDVVRDSHYLTVHEDVQSGPCTLSIGMYNLQTNDRLPAYGDHGRFRDDVISVGGVTIE